MPRKPYSLLSVLPGIFVSAHSFAAQESVKIESSLQGAPIEIQSQDLSVSEQNGVLSVLPDQNVILSQDDANVQQQIKTSAPQESVESSNANKTAEKPSLTARQNPEASPDSSGSRIFAAVRSFKKKARSLSNNVKKLVSPDHAFDRLGRLFDHWAGSGRLLAQNDEGTPALNFGHFQPVLEEAYPGQLPTNIMPETYDLKLNVTPETQQFSGEARVQAVVKKETDKIVLNAADMDISEVRLNDAVVPQNQIHFDQEKQILTIDAGKALPLGPLSLGFRYSAKLNQNLKGLYLSRARHNGKEENYAFSQFEAADARRMFPSWDEPFFKAKFKLTVTAPKDLSIVSNMPDLSRAENGSLQTVSFAESPKMSTYLLALAVARLDSKSKMAGKTLVRVWARPEDMGQVDFALNEAAANLLHLNEYYGVNYPLPKLDLVAVPDFDAGAMENWGAIFFRDAAIFTDARTSLGVKKNVGITVDHEQEHLWFGDLVTMKWWDGLFLNEAFADFRSYKTISERHPDWHIWEDFLGQTRSALAVDSLRNTRPIFSKVSSPQQAVGMFDALTYNKGGAFLRMLENYLGDENFRKGLHDYLTKYQYQNTDKEDLWRELSEASGEDVAAIANDWITIPGYPLVSVSSLSADNRTIGLSQRPFSAHGQAESGDSVWNIPVVLKYKDSSGIHSYRVNLKEKSMTLSLPSRGAVEWVYANQDQTGFYRTALDSKLQGSLENSIQDLTPIERSGFLNDLWAQAKAGDVPLSVFLDALEKLKTDDSRIVLRDITSYLLTINDDLTNPQDRPLMQKWAQGILLPHWQKLGWGSPNDSDDVKYSRAAVLSALGKIAPTPELSAQIQDRLNQYLKDPNTLDPSLVGAVLGLGAEAGDQARFEEYRQKMDAAKTPEERNNFQMAMTDFKQDALAQQLLQMSLTDEIRGQDSWKSVSGLLANNDVQGAAWKFLEGHWTDFLKKAGGLGALRIIGSLSNLWSREWLAEVKAFFAQPEHQLEGADKQISQTLESLEIGVRFKEAQSQALSTWLQSRLKNQ